MNGIIYCRVSSKEQMEGTSLGSQELACKEYARAQKIEIMKTFIEQGESAKFADRTQLVELIDFCRREKGTVNVLLVWKVDRFARNVTDHFNVKATLLRHGVQIVSVTEPIDTKPEGKLMETILAGFAQFDNDIRATRTVQGMRRKIQEGIFPWKAPLGYKNPNEQGAKKIQPDVPDQPTFKLLQRAWQEFATGTYTKAEIRRIMATWGVVTRKGEPLSNQSVDYLFKNPYYAGILIDPWTEDEHRGLHPAMVSREDFYRVQQAVARRNRTLPHFKQRKEFPLRGIVRCAACKRYLTSSFSRGRSRHYPYYHCWNRRCERSGKGLRVERLHEEFLNFLPTIAPKPGVIEQLGTVIVDRANGRQLSETKQVRTGRTLAQLDEQRHELIRLRTQRLISEADFAVQKERLAEQRASAEPRVKNDDIDVEEIRMQSDEISEPLNDLPRTWIDLPQPSRSRFQQLIFPAGFVAGQIRTAELGLLFRTKEYLATRKTSTVPRTITTSNQIIAEIKAFWKVLKDLDGEKEQVRRRVRRKRKR